MLPSRLDHKIRDAETAWNALQNVRSAITRAIKNGTLSSTEIERFSAAASGYKKALLPLLKRAEAAR